MPAGRPTDYKPEYCDKLVKHMAEGFSFEAFGGVVGCAASTLYVWEKLHPEFKDAKREGVSKSMQFWELTLKAGILGRIKGFSASCLIFLLKNRFGYSDAPITNDNLNETDYPELGSES
jgi:hypothetical protein